ncbi:DivIVA domain-containing protein [Bifidobacterium callimiconis]|uniref:DivIVA domain-containing protein n=1 Tax=Bifidobacterium callimiconis TaxID=2306973 RepID=UPI001BDDB99F|nr:DivIVA domain-containing protein [Bifidobacterium callimiconis]MBT1176112.1 DivIVA domain-containing protein [Bifidobacterium callimiconis]
MARKPAAERNSATIARAGKRKWGYDVGQVDAFLERAHTLYEDDEPKMSQEDIQNVSFALEKDGYVISQVDAALNRLEKAVVDKQTQWDVTQFGRVAWRAATEQLAHSLYGRADRPAKNRFDPGASRHPSYDRKQVDRLVNQVVGKIKRELGETEEHESDAVRKIDAELTSTRVSNIIFTQRTGKRGYSERQVDAYLNRAIQVLARLESFARLEGTLFPASGAAEAPSIQPAAQPAPVETPAAPLTVAASVAAPAAAVAEASAPVAVVASATETDDARTERERERDDSFYNLREAETEIFSGVSDTSPAADTPAAAVTGSLNGLMNSAAEKPAPAQTPAVAPLFPETPSNPAASAAPAFPAANETPTTTLPRPVENTVPQFTFAASTATPPSFPVQTQTLATPVEAPASAPIAEPAAPSYTTTDTPVQPAPSYAAPAYEPEPTPSYGSSSAPSTPVETHHGRHISYPSIESGVVGGTPATPVEASTSAPTPAPAPAAPSRPQATTADHDTSSTARKPDPDDYFSSLLDTSSIPAVDFHIPNLTFPSPDDDKETR